MELKMAFHSVTGRRMVEVYDNAGRFVAGIYPDEETNGIKIVSKHFDDLVRGPAQDDVPAMTIRFKKGE